MKSFFTLLLIVMFSILSQAQNKSSFDLYVNNNEEIGVHSENNSLKKLNGDFRNYEMKKNSKLEISMVTGGYFTIGLNHGKSNSALDDDCSITYGHPFALTSFPFIVIDGQRTMIDRLVSDLNKLHPVITDSSLFVQTQDDELMISFSVILNNENESIDLNLIIKNENGNSKSIGGGIVLDPGLGKWGDGHIYFNGSENVNEFQISSNMPSSLELWERNNYARGIGIDCSFQNELPSNLSGFNWNKFNKYFNDEQYINIFEPLYDLILCSEWEERVLMPGDSISISQAIILAEPDFSSKIFTRWNIPAFFSIENNQTFPDDFSSFLEINSLENNPVNAEIRLVSDDILSFQNEMINVSLNTDRYYQRIESSVKTIYEDHFAELNYEISENGQVLDAISKTVFIPATPISESGLTIVDDSLNVENFPGVDIVFSTQIEETGQYVLSLEKENIFLYENGNRITDFTINKLMTGGSNLVDVVFVLDVSGSMGDNIAQVRNNLNEFADSLLERGFDYRIGVVTFSTTVDNVWDLTDDIEDIKNKLAGISLWGGIEDSPSAIITASTLSFREGSRRTVIWVTDEEYPENNYTKQNVVDKMLENDITVNGVGLLDLKSDWFDPIVIPTGGKFFDIYGNFRDILLEVSHMESQHVFKLNYNSSLTLSENTQIKLEIRYAGLGGQKTFNLNSNSQGTANSIKLLSCYPNPFNPSVTFLLNQKEAVSGQLQIFNSIGQLIKEYNFDSSIPSIVWNAVNSGGSKVSSGMYFVRAVFKDVNNIKHFETSKILYLK